MTEQELAALVAEAAGVPAEEVVPKIRGGTQIKANALWEGSCSPRQERRRVGLFLAEDREDIALDGARRRMTLEFPFPDSIVILGSDATKHQATVVGYPNSKYAAGLADGLDVAPLVVPHPVYATHQAAPSPFDIGGLLSNLHETPNVVLQGPPGTGKSSLALALVKALAAEAGITPASCRYGNLMSRQDEVDTLDNTKWLAPPVIWEFVQLHPSYSYDDLVRRVVPRTREGNMHLTTEDSLLPRLCKLAELRGPDKPVVLILDEMNRGNLAAILGEFVFAIDPAHRGTAVRLQYQGPGLASAVAVPPNLWIIGTMNTADRSIAMVDYAIRRRFRFIEVPSNPDVLDEFFHADYARAELTRGLFDACNRGLAARLHIGHSEFLVEPIPAETWPDRMARRVAYHVLPLLSEYAKEGLRGDSPVVFNEVMLSLSGQRSEAKKLASALRAVLNPL